jgi:hypothetical protein
MSDVPAAEAGTYVEAHGQDHRVENLCQRTLSPRAVATPAMPDPTAMQP